MKICYSFYLFYSLSIKFTYIQHFWYLAGSCISSALPLKYQRSLYRDIFGPKFWSMEVALWIFNHRPIRPICRHFHSAVVKSIVSTTFSMQCSQNIKWLVLVSDVSFCFEMFRKSHIVHKVKVLRDCGASIFHFQNDMSPSHVKSYNLFTF